MGKGYREGGQGLCSARENAKLGVGLGRMQGWV